MRISPRTSGGVFIAVLAGLATAIGCDPPRQFHPKDGAGEAPDASTDRGSDLSLTGSGGQNGGTGGGVVPTGTGGAIGGSDAGSGDTGTGGRSNETGGAAGQVAATGGGPPPSGGTSGTAGSAGRDAGGAVSGGRGGSSTGGSSSGGAPATGGRATGGAATGGAATGGRATGGMATGGAASGGAASGGACGSGLTNCSGACLNLQTDAAHCGSCTAAPCPGAPPNGTPVCTAGTCDFKCDPGRLKCGTACYVCCRDTDCPVGANEAATCEADHTCSTRCVLTATRCRGTCRPMKVVGACMVAQLAVPQGMYWCDADSTSSYLKVNVTQSALDSSGTATLDQYCWIQTDDLTLAYCADPGRRTRMETGYVFTVVYDADGRTQSQTLTNGSGRPRQCMPPE